MTARHLRIQNSSRKFANAFELTLSIRIHLPADKIPCANTRTLIKFRLRSQRTRGYICVIKMLAERKATRVDKWTRNGGLEFGESIARSNFHRADKNTRYEMENKFSSVMQTCSMCRGNMFIGAYFCCNN